MRKSVKRIARLSLAMAAWLALGASAYAQDRAGIWQGTLHTGKSKTLIEMLIAKAENGG